MKNNYLYLLAASRWLTCLALVCLAFFSLGQTAQPPRIQSQRIYPGFAEYFSPAFITKASDGTIGLITIKQDLVKLSKQGEVIWTTTIPAQDAASGLKAQRPAGLAPTLDGGFVVLASDQVGLYITKFDMNGGQAWTKKMIDGYSEGKLIQTTDGGFLVTDTHERTQAIQGTFVTKFDQLGNISWQTEVHYPYNLSSADISRTNASGALSLRDGNFLLVGSTQIFTDRSNIFASWVAKLDNQGRVVWQNKYNSTAILDDVIESPFGDGSFIAAGYTAQTNFTNRTDILTIQSDGTLSNLSTLNNSVGSSTVGVRLSIVAAPLTQGIASYTIFDTGSGAQDLGNFRLTNIGVDHQVRWTKRLGGSFNEIAHGVIVTDDGYTVVGLTTSTDGDLNGQDVQFGATWLVNLAQPPVFNLLPPTYDCQTGSITFNTSGGDGSTITYTAPGITRSSLTSNMGMVEAELRNDPKPITISATQSGETVSYSFDFATYCRSRQRSPIYATVDSRTLTVGQLLLYPDFVVGQGYYNASDPNNYKNWAISATGLPPGLSLGTSVLSTTLFTVEIGGQPTTPGVYPVHVTAIDPQFPNEPPYITLFTITIVDSTAGGLSLLAPTYNCASGAITFNTSGGNNSPVEFQAIGITDWTTNPHQFVDKESRTVNDVQPFTLRARQSGYVTTYTWDLKAACGRARVGVQEPSSTLSLTVLGNPVQEQLRVRIEGAEGQSVQIQLTDQQGRLLESRTVKLTQQVDQQIFQLAEQSAGLLLLRAATSTQTRTVKVLKQ